MIGIDEVGRGAWAGPLLVVAVRLKKGKLLPMGLTDSKKLTPKRRKELAAAIIEVCEIGEGWVSASVIDDIGLTNSMKNACMLATFSIGAKKSELVLLDGKINYLKGTKYTKVKTIIKADLTEPLVSAASVVAKVKRDELMVECAEEWPVYGFEKHVGYGTKVHSAALNKSGPCVLHRLSYKPVEKSLQTSNN